MDATALGKKLLFSLVLLVFNVSVPFSRGKTGLLQAPVEVGQEHRGGSSSLQLPEEGESSLILLTQLSRIQGPGQIWCPRNSISSFHSVLLDPLWSTHTLLVQNMTVMCWICSVCLIVVQHETHYCGVF